MFCRGAREYRYPTLSCNTNKNLPSKRAHITFIPLILAPQFHSSQKHLSNSKMNSRLNFAPIKRTKRIKTDFSSISLAAHDTAMPDPLPYCCLCNQVGWINDRSRNPPIEDLLPKSLMKRSKCPLLVHFNYHWLAEKAK